MWTRKNHLLDKGDTFEDSQKKVLESYVNEDGFPRPIKKTERSIITLGEGCKIPFKTVSTVLQKRMSVRSCPARAVPKEEVSAVLYQGTQLLRINRKNDLEEDILSAVDSFGAAFDVYLCIYNVDGLASGIYFYDIQTTDLDLVKSVDESTLRKEMYKAQTEQIIAHNASYAVFLVAEFERYQWRYRHEAALQHIFINAGQIMNPLILISTNFGHFTHISPAINDKLINNIMGHSEINHQTVYILSAG